MIEERLFTLQNRWFVVTVGGTVAFTIASVLVGFVWLPSVQNDAQFQGVWNAICSAAGVPQKWLPMSAAAPAATVTTSAVVMTPQLMADYSPLAIGRGATLALRCTMCHGARGVSKANSPNLAGQYPAVIYKQLLDFTSGARANSVMSPMVLGLSDLDMRDLAAYYASLPKPMIARLSAPVPAPPVVSNGSPMRNIASCASCHGGMDHKAGSSWLEGLPAAYTQAQLKAFASSARHNDINGQMRNIARNMTSKEIDAVAAYYAGHEPTRP